MKKLLVLLFALLSAQAFGQAYPGTVLQNSSGNYSRAVPYPQVLVCVANDGNVPCVTRATTYSDSTLGTQCTQTGSSGLLIGNPTSGANCNNPGIGDVNGNFQLYLANGEYTLCTFSGTWLCQKFTLGGAGGAGNVNNCPSPNSVAYYAVAGIVVSCDQFFTDDGSGHPTARSLGLTDSTHSGYWFETAGPALPTLAATHSFYFSVNPLFGSTYGLEPWDSIPANGDCVSTVTGDLPSWVKLHDSGSPCGSGGSAASTYRTCTLIYGADNAGGLANLDLGPQGRQCILPYNATIIQVEVAADTGTPSVLLAVNHQGSDTNILSSALSTAASGGVACSTSSGGLGFDGVTSCSSTLQNTSALQGDYIEAVSGTASSAHRMSIFITFTQPNFTSGGTMTSLALGAPTGIQVSGSPVLTAGTVTWSMPASWTTGDLLLGNGSNSVTRLPIGSNNTVLSSNGTTASWQAASSGGTLFQYLCANNGNGTTVNTLTRSNGAACQIVGAGSSFNLTPVVGITISGAGTTGLATIQTHGQASCVFDNGITQGDYFTWSSSTNGDCHDMGNTTPVFGAAPQLGTVVSATNASAGTYTVYLGTPSGADITGGATSDYLVNPLRSPFGMASTLHTNNLFSGGVNYSDQPFCIDNSSSDYSCMKIDSTGDLILTPNGGASDGNNAGQSAHVMINSGMYTAVDNQGTVGSGTVTFDMSAGMIHSVTASANITVANPTNLVAGQIFILQLCENATGGFTWSWGNKFINHPSPSTTLSSCSAPAAPTNFVFYAIDTTHIYTASSF